MRYQLHIDQAGPRRELNRSDDSTPGKVPDTNVPRRTRLPSTACNVGSGQIKSLVTIRFSSGRTEMPWGLNPSAGGCLGCSAAFLRSGDNSTTRPGMAGPFPSRVGQQFTAERIEPIRKTAAIDNGRHHRARPLGNADPVDFDIRLGLIVYGPDQADSGEFS